MNFNFITKPLRQLQAYVTWCVFKRRKNTIPLLNSWMTELPKGEFITLLYKPKNSRYKFKRIKLTMIKSKQILKRRSLCKT
jgi:hypothetical protein